MTEKEKQFRATDRFLKLVPAVIRRRGRDYFDSGAVLSLVANNPDTEHTAVVQGTEKYTVKLIYQDHQWLSECTCPMEYDCKHGVAAMLTLQERIRPENGRGSSTLIKPIAATIRNSAGISTVTQPPASQLAKRIAKSLGRPLLHAESQYVKAVQTLYSNASYRKLTTADLFALSSKIGYGWETLELWPELPRDDYRCWLFVAWELKRRDIRIPEFMEVITDFSVIEDDLKEWDRAREIEEWTERFDDAETSIPSAAETLDLRLMFFPTEARLQWRMNPTDPFVELKQAQAKKFSESVDSGQLNISPESGPLWNAMHKPWSYESWWSINYSLNNSRAPLNRVLRLTLASDRLVKPDGNPLPRSAEPLRLDFTGPVDGRENYELRLVSPDGQEPPPIHCIIYGKPAIYITEGGIFTGPFASVMANKTSINIPSAALETSAGLRFIHALGLPMPEHLTGKMKIVPVAVTLSCELKESYPGSKTENILIRAKARAKGMADEHFSNTGWIAPNRAWAQDKTSKTTNNTLIVHDRAVQAYFPNILDQLGAKFQGYGGDHWSVRLTRKTPELFVKWLESLPPEIQIELDDELATLRDSPISGTVSLDVQEAGIDWFDLKVILNVADTNLTQAELKLLLNARGGYVRLGSKGWRRLKFDLTPDEDEQLARLGLDAKDFTAEPQRFHALQLADDAAKKFLTSERVENIRRRVSEIKTRVTPDLPKQIKADLRPYQTEGYHFLSYLTANRFGGVLADDMGLGKTVQALTWLARLRSDGGYKTSPSLVVCPKSVTDNWRSESERFYPELRVRIWHGEPATELVAARKDSDLIVVNYSQLRSLSPDIANVSWQVAILDEAQYIKNPDSQTAQSARALKADHRLALTGTPIENRLLDLWSIFSYAMPGVLGNRADFLRRFNQQDDPLARRRLSARVRPFLLRRSKGQVAKELPDRVEEDLLCEMEGEQKTLYRAEFKRAQQLLLRVQTRQDLNDQRFNILTSLLRLRQICCHPALVNADLRKAESAKVNALLDLLEPLMEEGHKVLIFSQFVTMLDILRETIEERQWPYFYLAGSTENRGELVKDFQSAKDGAVFLISLKAGGFGLNLTAASYVVLFDPWWNPAVENQAIDRTHRIGQTSKVMAYRLLMQDSIEQKIRALQKQKTALADDVLGEEKFAQSLTLDDLRFLFSES